MPVPRPVHLEPALNTGPHLELPNASCLSIRLRGWSWRELGLAAATSSLISIKFGKA